MKKTLLSLSIALLVIALVGFPARAAAQADVDSANMDAAEEMLIAEVPSGQGDTGAPSAAIQPGSPPPAWGPGGRWAGMLNLSPDQVSRLKALRDRYLADTRDLRYDLAMRHLEAMRLFTDPKTSEAALMAKHKELSALRQKMMDRKAQFMIQARAILTADQLRLIDRHVLAFGMGMRPWTGARRGPAGCGCMGSGMAGQRGGMPGGMMGRGLRGGAMLGPGATGRPAPIAP